MGRQPEHEFQRAVKCYLDRVMPAGVWWSAVDHAARLSPRQGAERKARGVKRGIPDFLFILPGGVAHWIELKAPGAYQSPEQKAIQKEFGQLGSPYAVCRSLVEIEQTLTGWGVALRGRVVAAPAPVQEAAA